MGKMDKEDARRGGKGIQRSQRKSQSRYGNPSKTASAPLKHTYLWVERNRPSGKVRPPDHIRVFFHAAHIRMQAQPKTQSTRDNHNEASDTVWKWAMVCALFFVLFRVRLHIDLRIVVAIVVMTLAFPARARVQRVSVCVSGL